MAANHILSLSVSSGLGGIPVSSRRGSHFVGRPSGFVTWGGGCYGPEHSEKAELASVFSLCQGERRGPQNIELAVNEKLMLMHMRKREESFSLCLIDYRPCGPHLLHLRI